MVKGKTAGGKKPRVKVKTLTVKMPNIDKAESMLNRFLEISKFLDKVALHEWEVEHGKTYQSAYPLPKGAAKLRDWINDLANQQKNIIKSINKKKAIINDAPDTDWKHEDATWEEDYADDSN